MGKRQNITLRKFIYLFVFTIFLNFYSPASKAQALTASLNIGFGTASNYFYNNGYSSGFFFGAPNFNFQMAAPWPPNTTAVYPFPTYAQIKSWTTSTMSLAEYKKLRYEFVKAYEAALAAQMQTVEEKAKLLETDLPDPI
jgi:hypothetical protein